MNEAAKVKVGEIGAGFEQGGEGEVVRPDAAILHEGEEAERFMKRATKGVPLDHGIEKEDVGELSVVEDEVGIGHLAKGRADRDEVGEEEIGLM